MFHVGQKVVCVDASGNQCLKHNAIYVIAGVTLHDGKPAVYLEGEVQRVHTGGNPGCPFFARRFRPIVERKTDISLFTEMLTPTPQKVRESIGYDLGFTREEIGAE